MYTCKFIKKYRHKIQYNISRYNLNQTTFIAKYLKPEFLKPKYQKYLKPKT